MARRERVTVKEKGKEVTFLSRRYKSKHREEMGEIK